jgi:hypothetical protein
MGLVYWPVVRRTYRCITAVLCYSMDDENLSGSNE